MQIYSAMIPVKETFSKKEFVRLLLEWNQGSPHDRMKGCLLYTSKPENQLLKLKFRNFKKLSPS